MKKILLLSSVIITTMAMAGEVAPTKEIRLPNGEKRIIYLNGTDRWNTKEFLYETGKGAVVGGITGAVAGSMTGSVTVPVVGTISGGVGGAIAGTVSGGVGGAASYIIDEFSGKHK